MRQITCPVCEEPPLQSISPNDLCLCAKCGVSWTYIPMELNAAKLYEDEVYAVVDNRKSVFEGIIFSEARKVLHQARKMLPQAKKLLDFGSGKGQFLLIAKEQRWEGIGIETAHERAEFAKKNYGVEVLEEWYSDGKIGKGDFDFITLNHVLEHLPDPIGLLAILLDANLSREGLVYIEVPRANSWQAKISGKNWMHWDIPKHLTHWTSTTLGKQLNQIGFKVIEKRSFSIHLGVLGMLQALMSVFGFTDNLILRLKRKKSFGLLSGIAVLLPIAFALEAIACLFGGSGIFGVYAKRDE